MAVFLAFCSEQGNKTEWVKDPALSFYETALEFSPTSARVILYGDRLIGNNLPLDHTELAKVELSRLGIAYAVVLSSTSAGVCIHGRYVAVPFVLSGPLPYRLLSQCSGERVEGPSGLCTTYGG